MRRWLVVLEDPKSEFTFPEELEDMLAALTFGQLGAVTIARVQRGGLLAEKVMGSLPPVRHEHMGRPRGQVPRDFQRSRVYAWERALPDWNDGAPNASPRLMSLAECERLARRAAKHYGVIGFRVRDGRGARFARGGMRGIKLPVWARQPVVVLHETAHMIAARRGLDDAHGPRFVRLFIQLLATYAGQDEAALIRSARAQRIRVAGRQPVRQSPVRR